MLRHRAIRREYDDAGSVNALLALWAFLLGLLLVAVAAGTAHA